MVNERSGKLGEPVHPFGPGGEGGRDDAIYSSPANLQVPIIRPYILCVGSQGNGLYSTRMLCR